LSYQLTWPRNRRSICLVLRRLTLKTQGAVLLF